MAQPTHSAFVVNKPSKEGDAPHWREVGAVFAHHKGTGFDLVLFDQISVSGRIVCMPRKEREPERPDSSPAPAARSTGPSGRR